MEKVKYWGLLLVFSCFFSVSFLGLAIGVTDKLNLIVYFFALTLSFIWSKYLVEVLCEQTDMIYSSIRLVCTIKSKAINQYNIKGGSVQTYHICVVDESHHEIDLVCLEEQFFFLVEKDCYELTIRRNRILDYKILSS